ncbi:phage tail protein [Kosakonia sp. H02]|nr:phage tail protein [Kosakonia sp. H02]
MTTKYYAILTNQGAAKLANATALGTTLNLTQMAVGDANGVLPTPNASQTALINQTRIASLNTLSVDPDNESQIIAEQIIPENEGGFWIREIGLYDDTGVLIAVANCPETYKPLLQEGSGRTQTIRMAVVVSSTAAVTLKIDPSVVLATRKYADELMNNHLKAANPHPQYLQITQAFKEIANAGSDAVAAALKNLGLGDAAKKSVGTGAGQIPDMSSFAGVKGASWLQRHPSGLIECGGSFIVNPAAGTQKITVNYPIPFPSACVGIWFSIQTEDPSNKSCGIFERTSNLTSFIASIVTNSQNTICFRAVGY